MVTVRAAFAAAGLSPARVGRWGHKVPMPATGAYVVASTDDLDDNAGLAVAPIASGEVDRLLEVRPELRLDGQRPSTSELVDRLASMWIPDEPILYIGMAGISLTLRLDQYYKTPLGARQPHAGGWPIKTLGNLSTLYVHVAECVDTERAEAAMLGHFAANVPPGRIASYCDASRIMPFANLEYPKGTRKRHGITGAREPRAGERSVVAATTATRLADSGAARGRTQRVTRKDIEAGRVRVPIASKRLLPSLKQRVSIELKGRRLEVRWDPRIGPDKERSGVLSIPRDVLAECVEADEVLTIDVAQGAIRLR